MRIAFADTDGAKVICEVDRVKPCTVILTRDGKPHSGLLFLHNYTGDCGLFFAELDEEYIEESMEFLLESGSLDLTDWEVTPTGDFELSSLSGNEDIKDLIG